MPTESELTALSSNTTVMSSLNLSDGYYWTSTEGASTAYAVQIQLSPFATVNRFKVFPARVVLVRDPRSTGSTPITATITASTTSLTKNPITLTLTTNIAVNTPSGWTRVTDTKYTKEITSNQTVPVTLVDATESSNTTSTSYTVSNIDTTVPVITLNGSQQSILLGESYSELGATCSDTNPRDGTVDCSSALSVDSSGVDISTLGTYSVSYSYTDAAGNTSTVQRTVTVVSNSKPLLSVVGSGMVLVEQGFLYTDSGATATDHEDGDISGDITITGEWSAPSLSNTSHIPSSHPSSAWLTFDAQGQAKIDTSVLGDYRLYYHVEDSDGNTATQANRLIQVQDTTPPTITLSGSTSVSLTIGESFTDPGATCSDENTCEVSRTGSVDTTTVGDYTLTYTATDPSSNTADVTRSVKVKKKDDDSSSSSSSSRSGRGGGMFYSTEPPTPYFTDKYLTSNMPDMRKGKWRYTDGRYPGMPDNYVTPTPLVTLQSGEEDTGGSVGKEEGNTSFPELQSTTTYSKYLQLMDQERLEEVYREIYGSGIHISYIETHLDREEFFKILEVYFAREA